MPKTIDTTQIHSDMLTRTESVLDQVSYDDSKAQMMYAIGFASAMIELMGKIADEIVTQNEASEASE